MIPLPADAADSSDTLGRLWVFDGIQPAPVEVELHRTEPADAERRPEAAGASQADLEKYLQQLHLEASIIAPRDRDWERLAQLAQRTHQFNLSLTQRTSDQLRQLAQAGVVRVLRARDRFGDYGLVGVCIVSPTPSSDVWEVDTLVMSSRTLGRGLEQAFLHAIGQEVISRGATTLVAASVEGPHNGQVTDCLRRSGFSADGQPTPGSPSTTWRLPLSELPAFPAHVQLTDAIHIPAPAS